MTEPARPEPARPADLTLLSPPPPHSLRGSAVAALCTAALLLYPAAMALPVIEISRFGYTTKTTIWSGAQSLIRDGHLVVGLIVLICSIVIPLLKLLGLLAIVSPSSRLGGGWRTRHRAAAARWIEALGRWGMVDVLLVAVLVAAVKLGDLMTVHPGPGAIAFAGVVALSLLASTLFDPRALGPENTA